MASRSGTLLVALGLAASAACGLRASGRPDAGAAPVGLLTEGSAFTRPGVREDVARAVERTTGRRVLLLDGPVSVEEPRMKALTARLAKENPGLARYDWREPQCAAQADVLTATQRDLDAVYRVSLDLREQTRPAAAAEAEASTLAGVRRALRLVTPNTVREETLAGRVELAAFAPGGSARVPVRRQEKQVEPSALTPRLDVDAAVAEAMAALPPIPAPQWERTARTLVSAGCPFRALVVAETRLPPKGAGATIRKTALAAAARSAAPRPATRSDEPVVAAEPRAAVDQHSCNALCSMHMVQLCNNDKILWSTHRAKWEATACGTRRTEPFLKDCYRQQWLSSTFREACLVPCERTPEGRDRLLRVLEDAGCLRRAS